MTATYDQESGSSCWSGDRLDRLRGVYSHTAPRVRSVVRHLGVPAALVDPVTREAYVEVVRRGESLQNMGATRSLLSRVARKISARERSRPGGTMPGTGPGQSVTVAGAAVGDGEAVKAVEQFLENYDLESRDVFVLGTIGAVPSDRIAGELGLAKDRVKAGLDDMYEQFAALLSSTQIVAPEEAFEACVEAERRAPTEVEAELTELIAVLEAKGPMSLTDMPVVAFSQVTTGSHAIVQAAIPAETSLPDGDQDGYEDYDDDEYEDDYGSGVSVYEPERLLGRGGMSRGTMAAAGTILLGLVVAVVTIGSSVAGSRGDDDVQEDPVAETAAEEQPAEGSEGDDAEAAGSTGAPETSGGTGGAAAEAAASGGTGTGTAGAAPDEGTGDSAGALAKTKKGGSSGATGGSGGSSSEKSKKVQHLRPKGKKKKRKKKKKKYAENDPGRVIYELEMLGAAKKSLASNPDQALYYAKQHAREFPKTQFIEQRREVMIKALCKLGRKSEAQKYAKSGKSRRVFNSHCK